MKPGNLWIKTVQYDRTDRIDFWDLEFWMMLILICSIAIWLSLELDNVKNITRRNFVFKIDVGILYLGNFYLLRAFISTIDASS